MSWPRRRARCASRNDSGSRTIVVTSDENEEQGYKAGRRARVSVKAGETVQAADALTEGPLDPEEILDIQGIRAVQRYLVDEVQSVHRSQGVSIHDKHIEIIVREMLKKVTVQDPGDTELLPGDVVESRLYATVTRDVVEQCGKAAEARPVLMGITKVVSRWRRRG